MKKVSVIFFAIAITSGCANQQSTSNQAAAPSAPQDSCATNFVTDGSFFTGTRFSTFQEFPKKTVPGAFDALLQSIATSGYQIVSSSKESGLISASQSISYGQGKTAPLNFVVKKTATPGVRVDISFSMSGGVSASTESAQREFCKLLASVAQSPDAATTLSTPTTSSAPSKQQPKKTKKQSTSQ